MKGLLELRNTLAAQAVPAPIMAAADWHHARACEAYAEYQLKLDLAERETKHTRYLQKVAAAETFLKRYQRHTIVADSLTVH